MRFTYFILALLSVFGIYSADLRSDLRDFIDLVPRARVAFIAGRHFLLDPKFRAAFNYLRSSDFDALVRNEISRNQEVQDVIDYLERDVDLNVIPRLIKSVVIRLRPAQEYGVVRTLASFIQEVANILPDDKIANLIRQKVAADPEFASLYAKVVDPQFKTLVYLTRNSTDLAGTFQTLINNQVDVDLILEIGFLKLDEWDQLAV